MSKSISIIDKDYKQWVKALVIRYRQSQIKAAVKVNKEVLRFYWELGKDIVERDAENHYGSRFYPSLSRDLKEALQTDGFSERNLRYMKSFYLLYNEQIVNLPQVVADSEKTILPQVVAELFMVPWLVQFLERNLSCAIDGVYHPDIFGYQTLSSVVVHISMIFLQK